MKLAIFPLPLVLFPGGITRLQIFEQRYLRMVKQSADDTGFALTPVNPNRPANASDNGSWVKIIDFPTLDNGLLGIDIQAQHLVSLSNIEIEYDNLATAHTEQLPHWPQQQHCEHTRALATALEQVFSLNPQLRSLYPTPCFDDANWICARWLESLPINPLDKAQFFASDSYPQVVNLLSTLVLAKRG